MRWLAGLAGAVLMLALALAEGGPPKGYVPDFVPIAPQGEYQVMIPKEYRAFNASGIQCVWCSIQTLCWQHNIEGGKKLTDVYKGLAGPGDARSVMARYNIPYEDTFGGGAAKKQQGLTLLRKWVTDQRLGAAVGVYGYHMVVLCHFDDEMVAVIQNDGPRALQIDKWTRKVFDSRFDGWAIAVVPPSKPTFAFPSLRFLPPEFYPRTRHNGHIR